MVVKSGVYAPPKDGMPFLAVFIVDGDMTVQATRTPLEAEKWLRDHKADAKYREALNRRYKSRKPDTDANRT